MMKLALIPALALIAFPAAAKNCDRTCRAYISGAVSMAVKAGETGYSRICVPEDADLTATVNQIAYGAVDFSDGVTVDDVAVFLGAEYPCRE